MIASQVKLIGTHCTSDPCGREEQCRNAGSCSKRFLDGLTYLVTNYGAARARAAVEGTAENERAVIAAMDGIRTYVSAHGVEGRKP